MGNKTDEFRQIIFQSQSEPSQSSCIVLQLIAVVGLNILWLFLRSFNFWKLRPTRHKHKSKYISNMSLRYINRTMYDFKEHNYHLSIKQKQRNCVKLFVFISLTNSNLVITYWRVMVNSLMSLTFNKLMLHCTT